MTPKAPVNADVEQFAQSALITHVSHDDAPKAPSGPTVWDVSISIFLMGLLFFATLLNLASARQTVGLKLSYTLLRIARCRWCSL